MHITLTVTGPGDPPIQSDYTFEGDRVTIGRGTGSTLVLPDPKRVIGREHAAVVRTTTGYALVDLGSKNRTYVAGEPLDPDQPHPLQDGDTFSVGEFTLRCAIHGAGAADSDHTMFDGAFVNPFIEDAAVLAATLSSMAKAYEQELPSRRDEAVAEAVRTAMREGDPERANGAVLRLVGAALGGDAVARAPEASGGASAGPEAAAGAGARAASGAVSDRAVEAMLRALARVLAIPQRFRHEFIGQTIVQGPEVAPLYGGDTQVLRRHLLEPSLEPGEAGRRAQHLQEAADALASHHVALLEGYRAGVRDGSAYLLEAVDPTAEDEEAARPGLLSRLFPFYRRIKAAERAAEKWRELQEGDWAVVERRVFRPAFIRAYLQRAEPEERRGGDTGSDEPEAFRPPTPRRPASRR